MADRAEHAGGESRREADRRFAVGLARAFAGAVFFSLPLLMTMEMWWLGFYMDRLQLALFMAVMLPVLVVLDRYAGFEETSTWGQDVLDALAAYAVGFVAAAAVLLLFGVIGPDTPPGEALGKVALQAVPGSFGAVLASSQLGGEGREEERRKRRAGYAAEVFFMLAGALFLAFNVAPTEEMVLISYLMTPLHALLLAAASLALMHAFVYAVEFRGTPQRGEGVTHLSAFLRFTVVGYAVALLVSAYVLWTFGRFEGEAAARIVMQAVVLGFPAALGAAAARLIL
ncbi:MAG TPA: TIGR02587 family membrane protein [Chloroflexota bacterium]|nr:TIGR02587 family membrane protein [Chloroflexota bacterium]